MEAAHHQPFSRERPAIPEPVGIRSVSRDHGVTFRPGFLELAQQHPALPTICRARIRIVSKPLSFVEPIQGMVNRTTGKAFGSFPKDFGRGNSA
jgi:hypothetical protein